MYLLFAGNTYYPSGGIGDYIESFHTIEAARERALGDHTDEDGDPIQYDWYEIGELSGGKLVRIERGTL